MAIQEAPETLDVRSLFPDGTQLIGDYRSSGFGRTVSAESILDYTQVKSVIIDGRA